jgi:hypothetical protein
MPRRDPLSRRLSAAFKVMGGQPDTDVHGTIVNRDGKPSRVFVEWKDVPDSAKAEGFKVLFGIPLMSQMTVAFEAAELDSTYALHWFVLVAIFSWVHFGDRRERGRPPEWDSLKYCKLLTDFDKKKQSNPALSDEDVFRLLAKTGGYKSAKGPLSTSRLRKLLKEANDPTRNQLLSAFEINRASKLHDVESVCPPDNSGSNSR